MQDALRTYVEHISMQVAMSLKDRFTLHASRNTPVADSSSFRPHDSRLLVTGGGAFNHFLIERIREHVSELNVEVIVAEDNLVKYKEALIMAFIGVLRWRQENNVLASVTGAKRDSIGGALWIGQEA
jgi:anhydro-N-acetylmuramic acid kinase